MAGLWLMLVGYASDRTPRFSLTCRADANPPYELLVLATRSLIRSRKDWRNKLAEVEGSEG